MLSKLSPIVIFIYRRVPDKLINSLLENNLSEHSEVIIYSDGSRTEQDLEDVIVVRKYLHTIKGFKNIKIIESRKNKGLANSIIDGVSEVINKYEKVIVLEDDLIVSNDFLDYMNGALNFYENDKKIWSISGYGPKLPCLDKFNNDLYLSVRASSWGWATWKDRWNKVDWKVKEFHKLQEDKDLREKFNLGGNDMFKMLELQILNKIDSWAIRWCYSQFMLGTYTVYLKKSKVINDGFSDNKGTHNSGSNNKLVLELDNNKVDFKDLHVNSIIVKCFQKFHDLRLQTQIGYFLKKFGGYKKAKRIYKKFMEKIE